MVFWILTPFSDVRILPQHCTAQPNPEDNLNHLHENLKSHSFIASCEGALVLIPLDSIKVKVSLWFTWAPPLESVLGEWKYSSTPRPLYAEGRSPCYPLDRLLGGPQNRSGRGGEKNFQPLLGLEPPEHPACSPAPYRWANPAPIIGS
jgi:hypothetical protein